MIRKHPCDGCIHWRRLESSRTGIMACHYCVDTGRIRGCDPGEGCARKESRMRRKRWANKGIETVEAKGEAY